MNENREQSATSIGNQVHKSAPHNKTETINNDNKQFQNLYSINEKRVFALTGLHNLGIACYLNSAVQCMYNIPVLTDCFYQSHYKKDINRANTLEHKGNVAEQFSKLIKACGKDNMVMSAQKGFMMTIEKIISLQETVNKSQCTTLLDADSPQDLNKSSGQGGHMEKKVIIYMNQRQ